MTHPSAPNAQAASEANAAAARARYEDLMVEVFHLLNCGLSTQSVCSKLGVKAPSLARRMRRNGDARLAHLFERAQ